MSFFIFTASKIGGLITSLGNKFIADKIQEIKLQRKMQRIVDDATDRVVEQVEGYLKSEGLTDEKMKILIVELSNKLQFLVDNPTNLFSGNLDGSTIFKQSHPDGKLPRAIEEEGLGQFYSILFPQIAHFLAGSKIALEQWKSEGYREEFKRLNQLAEQIRAMNAKVADIPSAVTDAFSNKESQESELLLREFAQTLLSSLLLRVDLSPLRAERALHGSLGDHFVIPAIRERVEQPELAFNEQSIFYALAAPGARRVLHGGAGIGKTTCSLWMQSRLLQKDPLRLTILVRLRQIQNIEDQSLLDILKKQAGTHLKDSISDKIIKKWHLEGRLILIFDGFDEIPEDRRDRVEKWLTDLSIIAGKTAIIITSRPLQSKHLEQLNNPWQQWDLLPFDEARIIEFIERWHRHLPEGELSDLERGVDAKALAKIFFKDQSLKTLADTPLMLGTLLFVHHRDKQLPNGRVDLYERYISAMLGLRDSGLGIQARSTKLTDREKRKVLARIALYFQINGKDEIDDRIMEDLLIKLLKDLNLDENADKLSAALCERTGLLQGPGSWSFMHKTIGEFLVAELVFEGSTYIDSSERLDRKALWSHRHEDRWTAVLFFWAGKTTPRELEEFIMDLLNHSHNQDNLLALSILHDQGERLSTDLQKHLINSIIKSPVEDPPTANRHSSVCPLPTTPTFFNKNNQYAKKSQLLRGLSRVSETVALSRYCRTTPQLNLLTVSAQSSKTSCGSRSGNVRPTTVSKSFSSGKRSDNAVLS